jgi:hypothetical protein
MMAASIERICRRLRLLLWTFALRSMEREKYCMEKDDEIDIQRETKLQNLCSQRESDAKDPDGFFSHYVA